MSVRACALANMKVFEHFHKMKRIIAILHGNQTDKAIRIETGKCQNSCSPHAKREFDLKKNVISFLRINITKISCFPLKLWVWKKKPEFMLHYI